MTMVQQTLGSAIAMTASTLVFLCLAVFHAVKAWRLDAAEYLALVQSNRPRTWRRWPIFREIWFDIDAHPTRLLWQNRLLSILAVLMGLFGLSVGVLSLVRAT